jgi:hypothetical protein
MLSEKHEEAVKVEEEVKDEVEEKHEMKVEDKGRVPTFIEVCSGCGGLSSGFIKAGFKPLLLNEIENSSVKQAVVVRRYNPSLSRLFQA